MGPLKNVDEELALLGHTGALLVSHQCKCSPSTAIRIAVSHKPCDFSPLVITSQRLFFCSFKPASCIWSQDRFRHAPTHAKEPICSAERQNPSTPQGTGFFPDSPSGQTHLVRWLPLKAFSNLPCKAAVLEHWKLRARRTETNVLTPLRDAATGFNIWLYMCICLYIKN